MNNIDRKIEIRSIGLLLLFAGSIGWYLGFLPWTLLIACIGYICWNLYQLRRVHQWLLQTDETDPPEGVGLWGDVLDNLYRIQKGAREERLRLQAAVDYMRDSFASLDDAAVMIDSRGNIEWSNKAAEKLLGLRYPEDTHQQLLNLLRAPEFIRYFESEDYRQSLQMASPRSNHNQLQINITYFGQGSRLLFARDITETYRLQVMRTDFVANVSHELRTPLTVINGYLETLADHDVADDLRWRRAINQMLIQSHRMESLIEDLIILSRLETMPEATEQNRLEIRPILESICEEVQASVKGEREISIDCDDSIQLMGSAKELRSAFANLISNAAKYTDPQGEITVRWYGDSDHIYLSVEDNGEGIDSQHLPRLTERFYRVDKSRSMDTGGTGLGLAIVKHILLHHQAELKISSTIGEGSTFSCEFPRSRAVFRSCSA
jgi:two-component system, OmpR family, phosphate regulon sensor histidine kinase PhoR